MGGEDDEVGSEGFFLLQGCSRKTFCRWPNNVYKLVIVALIVIIFAGKGQADLFNTKEHSKPHAYNSESEDSSLRIKQLVRELQYSDEVAEDFVTMVSSWQNRKSRPFFAVQRQKLHQIREDYKQGRIKIADVAKAEECVAVEIAWLIRDNISCSDESFELDDVIRDKQANCLGYTQIFYILSNSVGLSAIPINVVELQTPGPLPTGTAHTSCIVGLSDGRTIMMNLVPGGFVSRPFIMEERFTKISNYWQLTDKNNLLNIYRKIQILDRDGLTAYIYSNRGHVYASSGQFNQSISDYNRAIELNPNFAEAYNNRGVAYRNVEQIEQAIADYTKAIELNPNFAEAYNNRGIAYRDLGQLDQAIADYNHAIKLNPDFAEALNNRATAYLHSGQFSTAIENYSKATKLNPNLAQAYYNRGIAYGISGQFKRAISDFNRAIKLSPHLAMLYYSRGNAYGKLVKFDLAIADYTKAIELDSNFTKAYNNRAVSYALLEKYEYAKKDLLKILELNPQSRPQVMQISDEFKLGLKLD